MRSNSAGVLIYLAILLLPGLLIDGIDWRAHLGGLIAGGVLGAAASYAPVKNRNARAARGPRRGAGRSSSATVA